MSNTKRAFVFKLVLMGEGSVGKTSIRSKFMGAGFKSDYIKTIGADFASKEIKIGENMCHFQIWDLAGQKMYRHVRASFYSGCKCGFLVFDLTQPETLEELKTWVDEAVEHSGGFLKIFIVLGNKNDLKDQIKVKDADVKKILKKIKSIKNIEADYMETSALTGENINEAFEKMARMILEREGFPREGLGLEIDDEILEKHHEDIQSLITIPEARPEPKEEAKKSVDISNLGNDEVQHIVKTIMDKINQLTQITAALEERLRLVETKKVSATSANADIHEIRSKIGDLENQLEKFSIAIEESDRKPIDFPTVDSQTTIPVPSMNDIEEEPIKVEDDFEVLDRTLLSTMEVLNDSEEEASITSILTQTEAETEDETKTEIESEVTVIKEIVDEKQEDKKDAKAKPKDSQLRCPKCGSKLSFIKQYNRWYCYRCKLYV